MPSRPVGALLAVGDALGVPPALPREASLRSAARTGEATSVLETMTENESARMRRITAVQPPPAGPQTRLASRLTKATLARRPHPAKHTGRYRFGPQFCGREAAAIPRRA